MTAVYLPCNYLENTMRKIISILFLLIAGMTAAQDKGIIQGIVLDKEMNNEPLAFANIYFKEAQITAQSNIDGAYAFEANAGTYTLVLNFAGYEKVEIPNVIVKAGEITSVKNIAMNSIELMLLEEAVIPKDKK